MNREIKFRAWSKNYKEFIAIGFNVLGETTCFNLIELWYMETKDVKEGFLDLMLNDVYLQQFTGLLDSHRNEIYEGDILTFPIGYDSKEDYFVCKFTNGGFNFFTKSGLIKIVDTTIYTVVGNINEHSNLML